MSQLRPIVTFLSLVGVFCSVVYPVIVWVLFDVSMVSSPWGVVFAVTLAVYWIGCYLSCLSFLRGAALVGVGLSIHLLVMVVVVIGWIRSHWPVGLVFFPVWLFFVILYGLMVKERLSE